jgi:hypothetical protein
MFQHRAWVPLVLIVVLHTMTVRGEEDEPWEDLFNGKDFKGWKDAKHARFAKGEAVIAVPPKSGTFDREITYERNLDCYELEYEFQLDEHIGHALWLAGWNGELRPQVEFEPEEVIVGGRITPRKWHKLRVERRCSTGKGKTYLDGKQINEQSFNPKHFRFAFSADKVADGSVAHLRNVRLLDLTTSLKPGADASDGLFHDLKGLSRLAEVDVSNSEITDITLEKLSPLKSLRKLNVRGTRVTDDGVRKFRKAVPECEVER